MTETSHVSHMSHMPHQELLGGGILTPVLLFCLISTIISELNGILDEYPKLGSEILKDVSSLNVSFCKRVL